MVKIDNGAWRWSTTGQARRQIIDAARNVFIAKGFAKANIADIVTASESSTGSLYHHFGGKAEIFIATWEEFRDAQFVLAKDAVARARDAGTRNPLNLFCIGAAASLDGVWTDREAAALYAGGDAPAGFLSLRRQSSQTWVRQNAIILGLDDTPKNRLLVSVLTEVIDAGGREVIKCADKEHADEVAAETVAIIRRIVPA
jgi:AcrR family transcriptional regulator